MAKKKTKIEDLIESTDEAWDSGKLGRDEEYVGVVEGNVESEIDDALELQLISIRLQKSLIEDFKMIAKLNGIGYQPLMRQILTRFAECEKKQLINQLISERLKEDEEKDDLPPKYGTG